MNIEYPNILVAYAVRAKTKNTKQQHHTKDGDTQTQSTHIYNKTNAKHNKQQQETNTPNTSSKQNGTKHTHKHQTQHKNRKTIHFTSPASQNITNNKTEIHSKKKQKQHIKHDGSS